MSDDFPNVHSFVSILEKGLRSKEQLTSGIAADDSNVDSFVSIVEKRLRSELELRRGIAADWGTSSSHSHVVHGFDSVVVDNEIKSDAHGIIQGLRLFALAEVAAVTNNFSPEYKIGNGNFGAVYKAKLNDGREVAIKRCQQKVGIFPSELAFLSHLHHNHFVKVVGLSEDNDQKLLLVYEYMKNGSLYDHLHDENNLEEGSSVLNSWKKRIQIALSASRGIQYLHYAVPPIIHGDMKSSNIFLDADWMARVSEYRLPLMRGIKTRPWQTKEGGTAGYIDPAFYNDSVLTEKSDMYAFGVVLLELLTGKKAIFKHDGDDDGDTQISVVDFAVPVILAGELDKILDPRVGAKKLKNEAHAMEIVASTAMDCVKFEREDRPSMADVVVNLERALIIFG